MDDRNWVADFGGFKGLKQYFECIFDHTVVIADDDPKLMEFEALAESGVIQLITLPHVGCERFAEHVFVQADEFVKEVTGGRVRVLQVEFRENNKNSAICRREDVTAQ
jgi:6-pyruvoyltetrahydropterin/6-carboxytetrahydropterin synthase